MLRYYISQKMNGRFPYGTLFINLLGALLLGIVARNDITTMLLLGTGFLGAFTTFSTLNVEIVKLYPTNKNWCIFYIGTTYIFGPLLFLFAYTFHL
ncbi:CrcB family protein [Macrococcoides goetzii]|nr:CrcB family protein [Macrococcus goetzii]TDM46568.1 CrcB family protein [Macrococcus goetzii]TDM50090.1 CrcB family protein [Macrococcus goetzii]